MFNWNEVRGAVSTMAVRVAELFRSVPDPGVPALGAWDAGGLAAHMTHVFELGRDLLQEVPSPLADLADLGEFTQAMVRDESAYDLPALAARVVAAAEEFLTTAAHLNGTEPRMWLGGVKVTSRVLAAHIVSESTVHGLDLARATGRPWPLSPADALLAFEGFIRPMYEALAQPDFAVDQRKAAGLRACFDVRLRGGSRWYFVFADGGLTIEPPGDRPVDCHLSIDPRALMLLAWHREGLVRPILKGQVIPWGRKPWLAPKLPGLLQLP